MCVYDHVLCMTMKPDAFRIFTCCLGESCRFYTEKMGWHISAGFAEDGYVIFQPGGIQIVLEEVDEKTARLERLCPRYSGLSLRCHSIEAEYKMMLARGVTFTDKPAKMPWGGWLAHFKDDQGNIISLVEYEESGL